MYARVARIFCEESRRGESPTQEFSRGSARCGVLSAPRERLDALGVADERDHGGGAADEQDSLHDVLAERSPISGEPQARRCAHGAPLQAARPSSLPRRQHGIHQRRKIRHFDRFADEPGQRQIAQALHRHGARIGAGDDDGDLGGAGIGAEAAEHFFALDIRQAEIEQDERGQMVRRELEPLL